jgi:hypothetical protein
MKFSKFYVSHSNFHLHPQNHKRASRSTMLDTTKILSYPLGAFMFLAGANKLFGSIFGSYWAQERYLRSGHSLLVFYGSGLLEVVASSLLFSSKPEMRLIAVVALLGMMAGLEWAGWKKGSEGLPLVLRIPALLTEVGLGVLGWWSWCELSMRGVGMERAGLNHGRESWFCFILKCLIDYQCLSYILSMRRDGTSIKNGVGQ